MDAIEDVLKTEFFPEKREDFAFLINQRGERNATISRIDKVYQTSLECQRAVQTRDVEAEAESGTFSVEAEKQIIHRFHIGGKNGERKEIGSAILCSRTNRGSINIKK